MSSDLDARVVMEDAPATSCRFAPGSSAPGGPCGCTADCSGTGLCSDEPGLGFPQGSCEQICTSDAECGPNQRCKTGTISRCVPLCTTADECGLGRYCFAGQCMAFCQRDSDCLSGHCDAYRGRCVSADFVPTGGRTGDACVRDEECRSQICSDGLCDGVCSRRAQGCPDGDFCLGDDMFIDAGQCLQRCTSTSDCRATSQTCSSVSDIGGTAMVCF